ncbi:MAG: PaeR7I family type II restriction endonuclease, partial [Candidatus Rifleibacteriota bacterium]
MALNLVDYQKKVRLAVKAFWKSREAAKKKQVDPGKADQGERSGVTSGKNMDGFIDLVFDL